MKKSAINGSLIFLAAALAGGMGASALTPPTRQQARHLQDPIEEQRAMFRTTTKMNKRQKAMRRKGGTSA